jgi:tetratricopeptide (TPR) repeat protein
MVLSQTSSAHNSGEISALYQQGLEQYTSGDYKAATETWGKIEKLQPKSTTVQTYQRQTADRLTEQITQGMNQLEVLERKGRWREALTLANRLHELAPSNKEISAKVTTYQSKISSLISEYQTQGVDFYNRGYYVSAQNSFYSILALDPNNSSAKDYLARMKGKIEKKNANELYLLGVQAYTNNQYEQAIQYWQQVLEIDSSFDNAAKNIQRARDKLAQLK